MANIFKNPLVLAETVVGSLVDQRAVVLYEQQDFLEAKEELEKELASTELQSDLLDLAGGTVLYPTVQDFIRKRNLKELFTGNKGSPESVLRELSDINGFNMYGISYMDASVDISSDLCDHPIETGQVITDTSIQNPITAEVNIVMPTAFYTRIYEEIKKYYQEKKKIILLTKFGMYWNLVIQNMPYKLANGDVDRPTITLSLRQIMEVEPTYNYLPSGNGNAITPSKALVMDDTDMTVVNQNRFTQTLTESLEV